MEDAERHEAFRAIIAEALGDRLQGVLTEPLDMSASAVSRLVNGEDIVGYTAKLNTLANLEEFLGLGQGRLVTEMGYVPPPQDVRGAIDRDPNLAQPGKEVILVLYDHYFQDADVVALPSTGRRRSRSDDAHRKAASTGRTGSVSKKQAGGVKKQAERVVPGDEP